LLTAAEQGPSLAGRTADEIRAGHQLPDRKSADHTAWWHAIADEVIEWVRQPQAGAIQPV
jgi:hypothetical protein